MGLKAVVTSLQLWQVMALTYQKNLYRWYEKIWFLQFLIVELVVYLLFICLKTSYLLTCSIGFTLLDDLKAPARWEAVSVSGRKQRFLEWRAYTKHETLMLPQLHPLVLHSWKAVTDVCTLKANSCWWLKPCNHLISSLSRCGQFYTSEVVQHLSTNSITNTSNVAFRTPTVNCLGKKEEPKGERISHWNKESKP